MALPKFDFTLVGAAKSGTTSLHRYLARHPRLFLPDAKELALFLDGEDDPLQRRIVEQLYAAARPRHRVGLTHASMLTFRRVPARLRRYNPAIRVVAILRDPVERAALESTSGSPSCDEAGDPGPPQRALPRRLPPSRGTARA